jgi:hypothetical protein
MQSLEQLLGNKTDYQGLNQIKNQGQNGHHGEN